MSTQKDPDTTSTHSQLFTLRFWPEDQGDGHLDWRGKVQHVGTGEVRYFRDWLMLKAFIEGLLQEERSKRS